ncbi:MAG UNVERIFIED_CONTAM: hypothetical protein LVR29_06730 [Microcystis novacekii LVE1205-3]
MVANKNNKFLKCLTRKELKTLWEAEAEGKIVTWDQVNPKFPRERIPVIRTSCGLLERPIISPNRSLREEGIFGAIIRPALTKIL